MHELDKKMKTAFTAVAMLAYTIAGIVVLVLHGRKKLAPHVSDMFDILLFAGPRLYLFLGVILWPLPLLAGIVADKLSLRTSLKSGDGNDRPTRAM